MIQPRTIVVQKMPIMIHVPASWSFAVSTVDGRQRIPLLIIIESKKAKDIRTIKYIHLPRSRWE